MTLFFTQIYIYDNNNKNVFTCWHIKKVLKLRFFHKTFSNCQATYKKELYLLFEKSGNFSQSEHRGRFDSSPSRVCFYLLFKNSSPLHNKPFIKKSLLEEMEGVNDNASAFMHLNIKTNNGKKLLLKPSRVIYVRKLSFSTSW